MANTNPDIHMKNLLRSGFRIELAANIVLPWLVYVLAEPSMGRVHALMVSALPPIAWSVIQLIRKRRVDALSVFVVAGIGLSLLAFLGGGSFRFLELREQLVTGVMGLVFLGSVAIGRPVMVALLRSMSERGALPETPKLQSLLNDRRRLTHVTLGVGCLLLVQTAIAISLVFALPVREFLVAAPIVNYALLGVMVAGAFLYKKYSERNASAQIEYAPREPKP
jgi:uncharacterized membrane protein